MRCLVEVVAPIENQVFADDMIWSERSPLIVEAHKTRLLRNPQ